MVTFLVLSFLPSSITFFQEKEGEKYKTFYHKRVRLSAKFVKLKLRYKKRDFPLYRGVEVVSVNTVMDKNTAVTKRDVENLLVTHWERKRLQHDAESSISYNRLNHLDFKYQIRIKNKNHHNRKVFIRVWLGVLEDQTDIR